MNKKEIITILAVVVIITLTLSALNLKSFFYVLLMVFLAFAINILAKKAISYYLDSEIEMRLWNVKRYGFAPHQNFKYPIPAGIIMPILFSVLSFGTLTWLASLVFEVKAKTYHPAKRHGLYSYSAMTEYQIGTIAAAGIVANLFFAVVGYLIGLPSLFINMNVWLALFSVIPLSDLDGNKIFFGNLVLWALLASLAAIGVAYSFLLI